jgi:hypothetical protein
VFRRFLASVIDETFGLILLHKILRYGDRTPLAGQTAETFPDLLCGDVRRFFAPEPEPADLAAHRRFVRRTAHATVEDFAFVSSVRTGFPKNDVVRGRLWRAGGNASDASGPRRTLVLIDGIVQIGYGNEWVFASRLNPAGIDVVNIDLPFNHFRTPAGCRPGQLIVGGDLDHALGVLRQAVLDVWALVRGLQREGRRVALAGISLGGWTVLSTALVAEGVESVTAVTPPVDMLRALTRGGAIVRAARRGLNLGSMSYAEMRQAAKAISPSCWPAPLPGGRVFLRAADYDRFVPTAGIVRLAELWGARLVRYPVGHMQLASFPRWLGKVADSALETAWPA